MSPMDKVRVATGYTLAVNRIQIFYLINMSDFQDRRLACQTHNTTVLATFVGR